MTPTTAKRDVTASICGHNDSRRRRTMERFYAEAWIRHYTCLAVHVSRYEAGDSSIVPRKIMVPVKHLRNECRRTPGLQRTAELAESIVAKIEGDGPSPEVVVDNVKDLLKAVREDIGRPVCFLIDEVDAPFFEEEPDEVHPAAAAEVREARQCLALDQWTAAVALSMRTIERLSRPAVKEFGLNPSNHDFQGNIDRLENKVKVRNKQDRDFREGPGRKWADAVTELANIKDAWRNYCQHGLERYDEEEARKIARHVTEFALRVSGLIQRSR